MTTTGTKRSVTRELCVSDSLDAVRTAVSGDPHWSRLLSRHQATRTLHLAVFVEPFLTFLLDGRKTIESRFSMVRCPPYQRVRCGDVLLVKKSGGPVVGLCEVGETWSYHLDTGTWDCIRREFKDAMCAQDPEFWRAKSKATYATLMRVCHPRTIGPVPWTKRDRRGWVIIRPAKTLTR